MSESLIDDELAILCGPRDDAYLDRVAQVAQQEWAALYGNVRSSCARKDRLDKGISKGPSSKKSKLSEKAWTEQRRAKADKIARAARGSAARPGLPATLATKVQEELPQTWSEGHEKEAKFQKAKHASAMIQALSHGHLVGEEATPALKRARGIAQEREAKVRKLYDARHAKKRQALSLPSRPSLQGLRAWLDPRLRLPPATRLLDALVKAKVDLADQSEVTEANVFVTADVDAPPKLAKWVAIVGGGLICDLKYLLTNGACGKSLKFKAAVQKKRRFWTTQRFAEENPNMNQALTYWAEHPTSQWSRSPSQAAAIRVAERCSEIGQPSQILIFVGEAEQASEEQAQRTVVGLGPWLEAVRTAAICHCRRTAAMILAAWPRWVCDCGIKHHEYNVFVQ